MCIRDSCAITVFYELSQRPALTPAGQLINNSGDRTVVAGAALSHFTAKYAILCVALTSGFKYCVYIVSSSSPAWKLSHCMGW